MQKDTYNNLDRPNKFLGIIDYKSLIVLVIYLIIIWNVIGIFNISIIYKVYTIVLLSIPIIGLFYSNRYSDSIVDVIVIVLKYVFSPKIYAYRLESNIYVLK